MNFNMAIYIFWTEQPMSGADPESFVRNGPKILFFALVLYLRVGRGGLYQYSKRVTISPQVKCHFSGVLLAG